MASSITCRDYWTWSRNGLTSTSSYGTLQQHVLDDMLGLG